MNTYCGFYENDLNIDYSDYNVLDKAGMVTGIYDEMYLNFYRILYLIEGDIKIQIGNLHSNLKSDNFIVVKPYQTFVCEINFSYKINYLYICFHPSMIREKNDDKDFFRFINNASDENSIYDFKDNDLNNIKFILELIKEGILVKYGRSHIEPRVLCLISELDVYYDHQHSNDNLPTNSIPVKIMRYIETHYTEKITLQKVKSLFFVSIPTINKIVVNWSGMNFGEYITFLRLNDARSMLHAGYLTAEHISELCGFSEYSSFYRAYKKKFGISPKKDKKTNKTSWPLTE